MSDQENPYRSPETSGLQREKCKSQFRTTQVDEGPIGDFPNYYGPSSFFFRISIAIVLIYIGLAIAYPLLWAYGTGILLALGFGLLVTKLVFRFQRPLFVWGLAPVFGGCFLFLFWIVYMLS